jgi:hypothetical protein
MFRKIANLAICLLLLGCALSSQAQRVPSAVSPADDQTCVFNFGSGANNTFLHFCVAATGNITQIETPQGHEQLFTTLGSDGYSLCDQDTAAFYFDYGVVDGASGWGEPQLLSNNATSVKIGRTTSDGIWTLTQTISLVPSTPEVKIVMALKNNTAISKTAYLIRWADVNSDFNIGFDASNDFSATRNSAAGWVATVPFANNFGTGLQLENVGNSQFGFISGYARDIFHGPNACDFALGGSATPLTSVDGSIELAHVDTIGPHKTKMTTMIYKGF